MTVPPERPPRRALVLAGGGLKVAFQAGVLQVWLDEARGDDGQPLHFAHADGASGGVFNLAMWCQELSGREIADNWRAVSPLQALSLAWRQWLPPTGALLTYDRFRRTVLADTWGLDWDVIGATKRSAGFNLYDFREHRHVVLPPDQMDEDALISAVSLPMWFPPVDRGRSGSTWIDAVFATDANLLAAIDAGADELWVVWTVSRRGLWRRGLTNAYFQMIEATANSRLAADVARIERNNSAVPSGTAEFGRTITLRCLAAEVPEHYLFAFTRAGMREAVELGVSAARHWCRQEGIALAPPAAAAAAPVQAASADDRPGAAARHRRAVRQLRFRETMSGTFSFGTCDPRTGADLGRACDERLSFTLTVIVDDLDAFLADPDHEARVTGTVRCSALGGDRPVTAGRIRLFTRVAPGSPLRMEYRLELSDGLGTPLILLGHKELVNDAHGDLLTDTTSLYIRLLRRQDDGQDAGDAVAAGVVRLSVPGLIRQLFTLRAGPGADALLSFGAFFLLRLWRVYRTPATLAAPL